MGTGQTILSIGALMMLSFAVLNLNRSISNVDISISQNKYRAEALALLNAHAEAAKRYYFDETTLDTTSNKELTDFAEPNALGLDMNDLGVIDNFDDYNNLTIADTGLSGVIYNVQFEVDYVTFAGNQMVPDNNKQFHKRMRISICDVFTDPLLFRVTASGIVRDTIRIEFVNSYWFYN